MSFILRPYYLPWSPQSRQLRYATIPVMFFVPTGLEWFTSANPIRKLALE